MKQLRWGAWIALVLVTLTPGAMADGWKSLFNGQNLDGWKTAGDQEWKAADGVMHVKATGKEMGWLIADGTYSDFVVQARFQWKGGNSGLQIRSRLEGDKMIGYQCNLDPSRPTATGSLLEENARGLIMETKVKADAVFKKGQWNTYEISAIGDHIQIYVNGIQTVDAKDPKGEKTGLIALQMAPGEGGAMQWSDIRILEIPNHQDWVSLFNGQDLTHWKPVGDAAWAVEEGVIHGKSKGGKYGWLISDQEYSDFHFSTRFKMATGNSGIQFRSWLVESEEMGMVHGFQADLASGSDWINGHLYDQSEKGVTAKPSFDASQIIDWEGWNTYEITAIGPKVELFINGKKTVEHSDPTRLKGIFAFQIHAGIQMDTYWDDIRIIPFK
ncbi:MAG: DUF1080 domain-containing protein [bacterium]